MFTSARRQVVRLSAESTHDRFTEHEEHKHWFAICQAPNGVEVHAEIPRTGLLPRILDGCEQQFPLRVGGEEGN
jgi:hypothetical protein